MEKTIKTIITAVMAFVWAYMFTFNLWFSGLMTLAVGGLTYFASTCEKNDRREVDNLDK